MYPAREGRCAQFPHPQDIIPWQCRTTQSLISNLNYGMTMHAPSVVNVDGHVPHASNWIRRTLPHIIAEHSQRISINGGQVNDDTAKLSPLSTLDLVGRYSAQAQMPQLIWQMIIRNGPHFGPCVHFSHPLPRLMTCIKTNC